MQDASHSIRRNGFHRLRLVTAGIGMAAVVATSALTWSIAADSTTAAASSTDSSSTDSSSTDSSSTDSSSTDSSSTDSSPTVETDDSGDADASSGGS